MPEEYVWLLRADAVTRDPELDRLHGAETREYFAQPASSKDQYLGRLLLGLKSEWKPWEGKLASVDRCQVAYVLGVIAQAHGDLALAVDDFEVAASTNEPTYNCYGYARRQLDAWLDSDVVFEKWVPTLRDPLVASLR